MRCGACPAPNALYPPCFRWSAHAPWCDSPRMLHRKRGWFLGAAQQPSGNSEARLGQGEERRTGKACRHEEWAGQNSWEGRVVERNPPRGGSYAPTSRRTPNMCSPHRRRPPKCPKWQTLLILQYSRAAAACQGLPPEQSGALRCACNQPSPIPERGMMPRCRPAEGGTAPHQVDRSQQDAAPMRWLLCCCSLFCCCQAAICGPSCLPPRSEVAVKL